MTSKERVIDNIKVVCQCRNIKKGVFKKLIESGVTDLNELSAITGAGSGQCKGKRCGPRLEKILEEQS